MSKSFAITKYFLLLLIVQIRHSQQATYSCNASASCGCSTSSTTVSKIVGGETAGSGAWGWAVSLKIANAYLCGGSIISSSWIITAAHCIVSSSPSQYIVYAGSNTRWTGSQTRSVSQVIVHPQYDSSTFVNDMALLKLASPLSMSDSNVKTICLPSVSQATLSAGEWPAVGTNVVAVGWGTLSEGGSLPTTLQQVTVQTVSANAETCSPSMANSSVQLCAGVSGGGKDTCQGDSGGPLMMFSSSNQWILIGLTSSGIGCARADYSGMYTRVAAFKGWINSNTNNTASWVEFSNVTTSTTTYLPTTTVTTTTITSVTTRTATTATVKTTTTTTPPHISLHASSVNASLINALIALLVNAVSFRQI